ncbi:MAG: hemolysin III family protein [Pseudodesulfovibrio sp.]|uniref:Channel protein, hemolysin III family n=1 Tax=Pseudodesulfovibrio aespoeensis (strain ATCC 700646 / DSM 10631 / Aspo-2) TaxID=643562 RepID=E6VWX7_PSEA9|nr:MULTISPECIES: hemolysin III family protein [Pseudodesulfovibrio]MBU4192601.1 hemolysin III family protein [Pseudomonadota bacterium]ADU63739.1 channel protein, hemolysin III family [Pseudodesulfovibrio aespoeensis Aspo-2]MBU4244919.1 hemolysin III family protein [Pseudomonadota bacterium]MBU4378584.1 hemolysin III family protein [Pseudomonadota bacterium]MBU4473768.1 hemolysin III family protein [Pseudomonadota bacterium]
MFRFLRDPMNGLTHCVAAALAVAGTVALILRSLDPVQPLHIVAFSIFGGGMILLYTASTLYHWLPLDERGVRVLRRVDHSMIFISIAATYTPICLITLRGPWGWSILSVVWTVALAGILLKVLWITAPRWLSTAIYLGMGWIALVGIYPLVRSLPLAGLTWLVSGGLLYSLGAVIYALKRPDPFPGSLGFHEIFHLFVIGGSACHFILMYRFV